jgi:hypothetical protein
MSADFGEEVELSITIPDRELRSARAQVEDGLSNVAVGLETGAGAASRATGGGGTGGAAGRMQRRTFRWARQRTEDISDILAVLQDVEDKIGQGGDGGGGLLGRLPGLGSLGGLGGAGGALGAAALTGATVTAGALIDEAANIDPVDVIEDAATMSASDVIESGAEIGASAVVGTAATITASSVIASKATINAADMVAERATIELGDLFGFGQPEVRTDVEGGPQTTGGTAITQREREIFNQVSGGESGAGAGGGDPSPIPVVPPSEIPDPPQGIGGRTPAGMTGGEQTGGQPFDVRSYLGFAGATLGTTALGLGVGGGPNIARVLAGALGLTGAAGGAAAESGGGTQQQNVTVDNSTDVTVEGGTRSEQEIIDAAVQEVQDDIDDLRSELERALGVSGGGRGR